MRYVEGSDLKGLLEREGRLEPDRAVVCSGRSAALSMPPTPAGSCTATSSRATSSSSDGEHVYLADFGLTKRQLASGLTATGQLVGTPTTSPPSRSRRNPVDGRTDLYSLGCVLYECLTGAPPFKRDTEAAVLWAHVQDAPPELVGPSRAESS